MDLTRAASSSLVHGNPSSVTSILKKCSLSDPTGYADSITAEDVQGSSVHAALNSGTKQCDIVLAPSVSRRDDCQISNLNPSASPGNWSFMMTEVVKRARRLGGCTWCFSLNHICFDCKSAPRCAACFKVGHKFKACVTKSRPKIFWRPKSNIQCEKPLVENEEARMNSESPLNSPTVFINPIDISARPSDSCALEHATPHIETLLLPENDQEEEDMANFAVNSEPFVPDGLEVKDWARLACGRIVISGNPPRHHDEYAIITVLPPTQQNHLYEAMDEVVHYFEEEHNVRIESNCLSPLGLCLIQFRSPVARQAMINLSPHQLDDVTEVIVEEHDRGINLRSCPFTRTCWIMFLAFSLDF